MSHTGGKQKVINRSAKCFYRLETASSVILYVYYLFSYRYTIKFSTMLSYITIVTMKKVVNYYSIIYKTQKT